MKKTVLFLSFLFTVLFNQSKAQENEPILRLNLEMHNNDILDINTDAKGKYILTTSLDKTAKLWDARTGVLLQTYRFQIGGGVEGELLCGAISPNAEIVAVGGKTGTNSKYNIYIFETLTGQLVKTLSGLENYVLDLEFSPNGKYLAAGLGGKDGLVLFENNLLQMNNLSDLIVRKNKVLLGYESGVKTIAFSKSGKIGTVSYDGKIRLYDKSFTLAKEISGLGQKPFSISFSQDETKVAIGYNDIPEIEVRSASDLGLLYKPEIGGIDKAGAFMYVAFSADGNYLYGAGNYSEFTRNSRYWVYRKWLNQGEGTYRDCRQSFLTFSDLKPIVNTLNKGADIIYACYTSFGRAEPEAPYNTSTKIGGSLFKQSPEMNDYNILGNRLFLRINDGGDKIAFKPWSKKNVVFSLEQRRLYESDENSTMDLYKTSRGNLNITNWSAGNKTINPTINGKELPLWNEESSCKAVDVSDDGEKALFGGAHLFYCYSNKNEMLWTQYSGSEICETNISGNGKVFVAALMDGTINWYKMDAPGEFEIVSITKDGLADKSGLKVRDFVLSINGEKFNSDIDLDMLLAGKKLFNFKVRRGEDTLVIKMNKTGDLFGYSRRAVTSQKRLLCTLFAHPNNKDWILYSPQGYFDCTPGAEKYAGWHINQGENKEAKFYPLDQFYEEFYIPNLGAKLLAGEEISSNVKISNLKFPPKVKITSPTSDGDLRGFKVTGPKILTSENKEITVTVKATDEGGGIDEIRLYHNGKLVNTTQRGYKVVEAKGEEKTKSFTLTLTNGENKIKATAFSSQRTESNPDEIIVNYEGVRSSADIYMLVIGIDRYKNPKYNLNYAIADASAFKKEIESGSNTIFGKTETIYLSDANASKEGIVQAFNQLKIKAKANDVFVFYYAGHGVMSEEEKPEFYIIPYDVTQLYGNNGLLKTKGVSATELQDFSKNMKAQKQLFIFDACQSGGMVEHLSSRGMAEEKAIAQLARSTGTFWLTASNSEQFATEFGQLGHGLFTYTILQALKGDADGSSKDKKITVKEISAYLNDKVPEFSEKYKGSAQYPNSYGYGQDFPVVIVK